MSERPCACQPHERARRDESLEVALLGGVRAAAMANA